MAYVLALIVVRTGERTALRGMRMGALVWLGFIATLLGTQYTFEGRSLAYFGITAGYPLLGLLLMGAILGGWKPRRRPDSDELPPTAGHDGLTARPGRRRQGAPFLQLNGDFLDHLSGRDYNGSE